MVDGSFALLVPAVALVVPVVAVLAHHRLGCRVLAPLRVQGLDYVLLVLQGSIVVQFLQFDYGVFYLPKALLLIKCCCVDYVSKN